jgi:hypothetical protein
MALVRGLTLITLSLFLSGCVFFSKYDIGQTYIASAPTYIPQNPPLPEIKTVCLEHNRFRGFKPQEKDVLIFNLEKRLNDKLSKDGTCEMTVTLEKVKKRTSYGFGFFTYYNYTTVDLSINYTKNDVSFTKQYFAVNREEIDMGKGLDYDRLLDYIVYDVLNFAVDQKF